MASNDKKIQEIVILGGGVTGYTAATLLAHALLKTDIRIIVIDDDTADKRNRNRGAETLSPQTQVFHEVLGFDEAKLLLEAQGTFTFGSRFIGWHGSNSDYLQTYDSYGVDLNKRAFHNIYTKFNEILPAYDQFSLSAVAAKLGRFCHPSNDPRSVVSTLNYGLNLESHTYASCLKAYAERNGVETLPGELAYAATGPDGAITKLILSDRKEVQGSFFIDCSGPDALLLEKTLGVRNRGWSNFFLYDRCAVFVDGSPDEARPYSTITACPGYWTKSIPLKTQRVNQVIFGTSYCDEDELRTVMHHPDMNVYPVTPGYKTKPWFKNVVAFGEAALNLEPFTLSKMDILYRQIKAFLNLFPVPQDSLWNAKEYNRITVESHVRLLDYHLCHFLLAAPQRDTGYWERSQAVEIPDSLKQRIALFRTRGKIIPYDSEIIPEDLWVSLFMGFGLTPEDYDPLIDTLDERYLRERVRQMHIVIKQAAGKLPKHQDYLERYLRLSS